MVKPPVKEVVVASSVPTRHNPSWNVVCPNSNTGQTISQIQTNSKQQTNNPPEQ